MAINNVYGNMLSRPTQSYTRMSGTASGLGQKQPQTCPSGYRYDTMQGKCVAVNIPKPGFWNQVAQGVNSRTAPQQTAQQPAQQKPTFAPQAMPKPSNQYSPYANLIAQAIDLNPPLSGMTQPYMQMIPAQQQPVPVGNQLNINERFQQLLRGGS